MRYIMTMDIVSCASTAHIGIMSKYINDAICDFEQLFVNLTTPTRTLERLQLVLDITSVHTARAIRIFRRHYKNSTSPHVMISSMEQDLFWTTALLLTACSCGLLCRQLQHETAS